MQRQWLGTEVVSSSSDLGWDHSCDVWSVGCILIEYYLGSTLFQVGSTVKYCRLNRCSTNSLDSFNLFFFLIVFISSRPMTVRNTLLWWRESWVQFPHICWRKPSRWTTNWNIYIHIWVEEKNKQGRKEGHLNTSQHDVQEIMVNVNSVPHRKRRYVHRSKLDWDVHSSSGRYVRKHCKPLKVIDAVMERTTNGFSSFSFVYNWRKVQRATSVTRCAPSLEAKVETYLLCDPQHLREG